MCQGDVKDISYYEILKLFMTLTSFVKFEDIITIKRFLIDKDRTIA